ncbi:GntR family transcriptional regulator [Nocardiopsis potens]|uniref:GntR family transcriptional regulator n=1 Tax=Nocardiopsis potens TaxID=1246458 RepID=UPI00034918A5|nr:GntR family transcriptional regulator [Nocardiopsis potens]
MATDGPDFIRIDPESKVPPYEQIRSAVANAAAEGEIPVGYKLPTVRALAGHLSVAVNTVARAYRELEQAGVLETRGRSGTFVAAGGDDQRAEAVTAARAYADVVSRLGLQRKEALDIVAAALLQSGGVPDPDRRTPAADR